MKINTSTVYIEDMKTKLIFFVLKSQEHAYETKYLAAYRENIMF